MTQKSLGYKQTVIADANAVYMGVQIFDLMDNAGKAIAKEVVKKYGKKISVNILCGTRNNGGDGITAAKHLAKLGIEDINVLVFAKIINVHSKAFLAHYKELLKSPAYKSGQIKIKVDATAADVSQKDVTLECFVGTGIKGKLKARFAKAIAKVTKQKTKIVAIDVPVPGYKPHLSVSLMYPKTPDAVVVDIGIPPKVKNYVGPGEVIVLEDPKENSYKTQNGELFVYGGSKQFHGAPKMAIKMASKLVGSVYLYSNPENYKNVADIKQEISEFISLDDNLVEKYTGYANAFLLGPGLEENLPTKGVIKELLEKYKTKPALLDAYAISIAKEQPELLEGKILTPHRGEIRHIFDIPDTGRQKKDTPGSIEGKLKRFAKKHKCYILLKGHIDTLISSDGEVKYNQTGNQGMAKGGTGDILAGIIASFLTKNDPWLAMRAGAFVCGLAGDWLQQTKGYNYSATDLIDTVPEVIKWCKEFEYWEN